MWILKVTWFVSAKRCRVGLVLPQELPYHPNMCNRWHRKGKVCLQVRKKMSLVSGKKPGHLVVFQGKKLVFTSFTLDKLWVLTNMPQSAVLSLLCCFMIMQLCRSYPSQLRASPKPWPASPPQDLCGEMPVDAALQLVLTWPVLGRSSSPAQMGQAGEEWMSKCVNEDGVKIWPCRHCWWQAEEIILILLEWSF